MAKNDIYGVKKLRKIQLGKETVAGTPVAPTTIWRGTGTLADNRVVSRPPEDVGYLVDVNRGYIASTGSTLSLAGVATFEQFPIFLESGVKLVTPAKDGAGSGYISVYPLPTIAANTIKTRTVEAGDNQEVETAAYMFTKEITLTGTAKQAVQLAVVMEGRSAEPVVYSASCAFILATKKITDAGSGLAIFTTGMSIRVSGTVNNDGIYTVATGGVAGEIVTTEALATESAVACTIEQVFTAAATLPAVEEILYNLSHIYVDDVSGTLGASEITNTMMGFSWKATGLNESQSTGGGRLDLAFLKTPSPEASLEFTLEWNGKATAERRKAKLCTPRKLRLKFEGSSFAVAGTTYSKKTILIDGAGMWETFKVLDEQNGDDIVKATFVFNFDATAAIFSQITVVNALPATL